MIPPASWARTSGSGRCRPGKGRTSSPPTTRIAGLDIVDDALAVKARIGYVPEAAPLYDGMRVREFLAFMARIKGIAPGAVAAAVDGVCARLALEPVARLVIAKLSRGF